MTDLIRIFIYVMTRSLWFGTLHGLLFGTLLLPILSNPMSWRSVWSETSHFAMAGFGLMVGMALALICGGVGGVMAVLYHAAFFSPTTDLADYRRDVAQIMGLVITGVIVIAGLGFYLQDKSDQNIIMLLVLALFMPWVILIMAHIARQYPLWLIRLSHPQDRTDLPPAEPGISAQRNQLLRHISWMTLLAGLPAGVVYHLNSPRLYPPSLHGTMLAYVTSGLVTFTLIYLCAELNASLSIFLKRLIFTDYLPSISLSGQRMILTLIAFLFTCLITWWTLWFAPLYALFMAYHVYHTVAKAEEGNRHAERNKIAL